MKVGLICYGVERAAPPSFSSYMLEIADAISRVRRDVELVLLATSQHALTRLPQHLEQYVLPGCTTLPGLMSVGNIAIRAAARALKLDVVHDPTGVAPFVLRAATRQLATITTVHDLVSYVYPQTHTTLTNFVQRVWLPHAIRSATRVVTVSHHSQRDLQHYLGVAPDRVSVVPCGVAPRYTPHAAPDERTVLAQRYKLERPYILYLGDVQARKNVARLIEAFAHIRNRCPDHQLVIAGAPTWKYQTILDTVHRLDLARDVLFTGFVADADVPALYRGASVFVFPSLYEGFGRPPLEAMACGTPVVTSNTSSLPEVVGDAALTVDPYDVAALARAIERLVLDHELRTNLRQRGLVQSQQFTWDRVAHDMVAVYEQALDQIASDRPRAAKQLADGVQ